MSLMRSLQTQPQRLEFIQIIRLLRHMAKTRQLEFFSESMPIGSGQQVVAIEHLGSTSRVRLGLDALSGVKGVLPGYIYEELLASLHDEDQALESFLNIFNHRYYQLLHSSVEKGRLLLRDEQEQFEKAQLTRQDQRRCLANLTALPSSRDSTSLLPYSVLLGLKVRSLTGLKQLLCDYFAMKIHVRPTEQSIHRLPLSSLTQVGDSQGRNNRLGRGVLLGCTGRLHYQCLEVLVEPREQNEYKALQQDMQFAGRLKELVQAYLRETTDLKFYLYVKRAFISQPVLSSAASVAVRLGEANCLSPQLRPDEYRKILLQ